MEIEVVICKSPHFTHERTELYKELKNADFFVPEFFQSKILEIDLTIPAYIPAQRVKEVYERAKKENKDLELVKDEEAEEFFFKQFNSVDDAEDKIRKGLYSLAFILPLSVKEPGCYEIYKKNIPELFENIKKYSEINDSLERKFCKTLAQRLAEKLEKRKKEKLKVVIDSGYTHQYSSLKEEIEDKIKAKVHVKEVMSSCKELGFLEDIVVRVAKGEIKEENISKYNDDLARCVLFEALYSPYRIRIHSPWGIDRKEQEEVYEKLIPKLAGWGEPELEKFWSALRRNLELRPFIDEDDMKELLKRAGLEKL